MLTFSEDMQRNNERASDVGKSSIIRNVYQTLMIRNSVHKHGYIFTFLKILIPIRTAF